MVNPSAKVVHEFLIVMVGVHGVRSDVHRIRKVALLEGGDGLVVTLSQHYEVSVPGLSFSLDHKHPGRSYQDVSMSVALTNFSPSQMRRSARSAK